MKQIIILCAVITAAVLSGCNMMAGSGIIIDNEFEYENFTAVEVSSACKLTITQGEEFSTVISCDDNLAPYLFIEEADGTLKIDLQPYTSYNHITFEAEVVMPDLVSVKAFEASSLAVSGFEPEGLFAVEMHEASYGEINFDSAADITVFMEEASRLQITSAAPAGDLEISCSEASQLDMDDCPAVNADVAVEEASKLWVNLSGALTGSVTDASALYCSGTADVSGLDVQFASIFESD